MFKSSTIRTKRLDHKTISVISSFIVVNLRAVIAPSSRRRSAIPAPSTCASTRHDRHTSRDASVVAAPIHYHVFSASYLGQSSQAQEKT